MIKRDPLISVNSLRFLLMAEITRRNFYAGFRTLTSGEHIILHTCLHHPSPVLLKSKIHGGEGNFHSSNVLGRINLTYRSGSFWYTEDTHFDKPGNLPCVRLTIWNQSLPETVITALPGHRLMDVIDLKPGYYFGSKSNRIVKARNDRRSNSSSLELILDIGWVPLSHLNAHLR